MAKTFDEIPLGQNQQVKTSSLNTNIEKYLGEFNGNLDSNNMPVNALTTTELAVPIVPETDVSAGGIYKRSSRTPTQAYHDVWIASWDSSNIWTPVQSIDLKADDWRRGWNRLDSYSQFQNFPLEFDAREGMLVGCATIDWHRGVNRKNTNTDPSFTSFVGYDWWTEWAVFANNVPVARSGVIYPRRHTTQLPFSVPVGSQNIRLDIRFATLTDRPATFSGDPTTNLDIFSAEIFSRNIYR